MCHDFPFVQVDISNKIIFCGSKPQQASSKTTQKAYHFSTQRDFHVCEIAHFHVICSVLVKNQHVWENRYKENPFAQHSRVRNAKFLGSSVRDGKANISSNAVLKRLEKTSGRSPIAKSVWIIFPSTLAALDPSRHLRFGRTRHIDEPTNLFHDVPNFLPGSGGIRRDSNIFKRYWDIYNYNRIVIEYFNL